MEKMRVILFSVFVFISVSLAIVWGESRVNYGVTTGIITSIREDVIRNNLVRVGFLFQEFEKDLFSQITLLKNDKIVIGENYEENPWTKNISRQIYLDDQDQVPFAEVVFSLDLTRAYLVSLALSILITFAYLIQLKNHKKREIKKIQKKLEQEKIFELKQQAQEFVHDIKSPLVSLELALSSFSSGEKSEKQIGIMNRSIIRIKEIGSRFIENQDVNQGWVELILLPEEMKNLIQEKIIEHSCEINLNVEKGLENCKILAKRDLFKRIMSNLINNSIESLRETNKTPEIKITVSREDQEVAIKIEDNGPGFPEKILLNKDFTPLTTKNNGKGIGLSSANNYLDRWGGKLEIRNKDIGAEVKVTFKNYEDYQILLIDDDELNRMIWEREAKKINMKFKAHGDLTDEAISNLNETNTLLYLDSNLNNNIKGEDLIEEIQLKVTKDIIYFIQTGNDKTYYKNMKNLSGVSGKKPNWIS